MSHMHASIKVLQSMVAQDFTLRHDRTMLKELKQWREYRTYDSVHCIMRYRQNAVWIKQTLT